MKNPPVSKFKNSSKTNSLRQKLETVLGSPSFLVGDDERQFRRFETALIDHIKPEDIFEQIWTREIVEQSFEVMRLRRWKILILDLREKYALKQLLFRHGGPLGSDELLDRWMRREPEAQKKIFDLVCPINCSIEHIEANTVFFSLDSLSALDHLLHASETRKNSAIKELELYRDRKFKRNAIEGGFKNVTSLGVTNDKSQKD